MSNEYFLAEFCNDDDLIQDIVIDRLKYKNYMTADNTAATIVWSHVLLDEQLKSIDKYTKLEVQ